jgi:hypothetical protein
MRRSRSTIRSAPIVPVGKTLETPIAEVVRINQGGRKASDRLREPFRCKSLLCTPAQRVRDSSFVELRG